jgi:hypothetical protein
MGRINNILSLFESSHRIPLHKYQLILSFFCPLEKREIAAAFRRKAETLAGIFAEKPKETEKYLRTEIHGANL